VVLFIFWLILKGVRRLRHGDEFEWYIKLGDWEGPDGLQYRLDRLAAAVVTDANAPAGRDLFEEEGEAYTMGNLTQSPAPHSQSGTNGLSAEPGDSGFVSRADTGLGFGMGRDMYANPDAPRTPSGRVLPTREQNMGGETRRRPVAVAPPQPWDDDVQVLGQDRSRSEYRPGRLQSGPQGPSTSSSQGYDHRPLAPGGSNVI
jgi:hypothetical protein